MRAVFFSVLMLVGCAQSTTPLSESSESNMCHNYLAEDSAGNLAEAVAIIKAGCPDSSDVLCQTICESNGNGTWFSPDAANEHGHCEAADGYRVRSRCRVVPTREAHLRNVQIIDGNFTVTGNAGPTEEFVLRNGYTVTFP